MDDTTFMGVPRIKIDWSPRIDFQKCDDACMACATFCPHGVFEIRDVDTPKLRVLRPYHCVVFCRACANTCGLDAISFPDKKETTAWIKKVRKEERSHA